MTLEPIPYAQPVQVQKNRRGLLMGFGILAVCLGVLCIFWIGYFVFTVLDWRPYRQMSRRGVSGKELRDMLIAIALVAITAVIFIWGGIGMIRCRRWVAPLGHALSVLWLMFGLLNLEMMIFEFISDLDDPMLWLFIGISLVLMVILPLIYLRIFRSEYVAKTLEVYDPHPRWTDRYPRAVMSIGVLCAGAVIGFSISISSGVERFFTVFVYGSPAMAISAGWAIIFATACALCFFRPRAGWKAAMIGLTLYAICGVIADIAYEPGPENLSRVIGVSRAYDTRDYRPHFRSGQIINHGMLLTVCWLAGFWYLVAAREEFSGTEQSSPPSEQGDVEMS